MAKVINLWTGIPVTKVREGDIKRLAGLEDRLKAHLIGQDEMCIRDSLKTYFRLMNFLMKY